MTTTAAKVVIEPLIEDVERHAAPGECVAPAAPVLVEVCVDVVLLLLPGVGLLLTFAAVSM